MERSTLSPPLALTFVHNDEWVLSNSSSGGAFYALAKAIIEKDGIVFGSTIDEEGHVYHLGVETIQDIPSLMGSKYVFSSVGQTFVLAKEALKRGRHVLYSGTPCQINSLDKFLGDVQRDTLLLVDVICHGAPHPKYWQKYLQMIEATPPNSILFREKQNGWANFSLRIGEFHEDHSKNYYYQLFLGNYILLHGCYACMHKGENRASDITLGDAWGHETFDLDRDEKKGISLVFIRHKANFVLPILEASGFCRQTLYDQAVFCNPSYAESVSPPKDRAEVLSHAFTKGSMQQYYEKLSHSPVRPLRSKVFSLFRMALDYGWNRAEKKERTIPKNADVGIVSLCGYFNFGNKLQNYALQKVLVQLGHRPVNIYRLPCKPSPYFSTVLSNVIHHTSTSTYAKRMHRIFSASKKYERMTFHYADNLESAKQLNSLKCIIYGSDQIWNPLWGQSDFWFMLGMFPSETIRVKKFSYAASIANLSVDDSAARYFAKALPSFSSISVREKSSKDFLSRLGFKSEVHLDPVFLLDRSDWDRAIKRYARAHRPSHYVLSYLIESKNTANPRPDLPIINLLDEQDKHYVINQFDFVALVRDADLVVTDSFHAFAFSLIFGKKVVILKRDEVNGMQTRIQSMLSDLGVVISIGDGAILDCANYSNCAQLAEMKKRSLAYLVACLNDAFSGGNNADASDSHGTDAARDLDTHPRP